MEGVVLGEGGKIDRAVAQERAQQSRTQQCKVARPAGVTAEFGVFSPGHLAAVVIGAFHAPVAAATRQPTLGLPRFTRTPGRGR